MFTSTEYSFLITKKKMIVIHDPINNLVRSSILKQFAHV